MPSDPGRRLHRPLPRGARGARLHCAPAHAGAAACAVLQYCNV